MTQPPLEFWRLLLDERLTVDSVDQLLRRLAQPGAPRPLIFETAASGDGLQWLIGARKGVLPELRSLAAHHLAGARLVPTTHSARPTLDRVALVTVSAPRLPLDAARAESVTRAVYEAFSRTRASEVLVLQVVFGRGFGPHLVPPPAPRRESFRAEQLTLWPVAPDHGPARRRTEQRAEEAAFSLSVRIGARAGHSERVRTLIAGLRDALRLLDAPGSRLVLSRDSSLRLQAAAPTRIRRARLSTPEVVPLLALPVTDTDLPGLPLHPRRPLAPRKLETKALVFAETSAPGDSRTVGIAPRDLLQHLVITGPTGAGKSTVIAAIAEQWIRARRPLALLDPKRQLVDHLLARLPRTAAGRIVVLDPTDSPVVGFNPLDTAGRSADVVVDGILASLRVIFEDGWGPRTEDLLLAGLRSLALAGDARGEPYTLIDLPSLFTDAALRREVVGRVAGDPVLAAFWAGFDGQSETARAAMVAAPLNKLRRFLLRPTLVRVLGQSRPRFRVRDLYRDDRALLVPLNDALVGPGSAQLLGSLLVAELFQAAQERALEDDPQARPALIAIDEAQRFIHLPTALEDALATSRSYGVAWLAAHQYRAQLSPSLRAGFDSNARTKLVFTSAHDDARDYARLARTLSQDDFMALPRYEMYASLMHEGSADSWFAARALPPRPELGFATLIRDASRAEFGAEPLAATESSSTPPGPPTHRKARSR